MFFIYKTTNLINGKIYVGKHTKDNDEYLGSGNIIKRSIKKFGKENFIREILEYCETDDIKILNEKEKYWIKKLNSTNLEIGYNIANGGDGGDLLTNNPNKEDIINRIKNTLNNKLSLLTEDERKEKYGKWGEDNPNFGNKWNDEQKNNLSNKVKEYFKNNDSYIKGKTFEEVFGIEEANKRRKNISENVSKRIGDKNPFYNKHHTEETKELVRNMFKGRKPVNIKPFKIDDKEYLSLMDASKELNIHFTTIRWRLKSNNFKNYNYI
jgi:group I intron endonuclease